MSLTIAILGTGRVGSALAGLWAAVGHAVLLGSRDAVKAKAVAQKVAPSIKGVRSSEALEATNLVVEALPFPVALQLDPEAFDGKILISASNYHPQWNGQIDLGGLSHTQAVARRLPGTDVAKAFNMHWAENMARRIETRKTEDVAMLTAGGSSEAKAMSMRLIADAYFEPVDAGGLHMGAAFQPGEALYADKMTATPSEALKLLKEWSAAHSG